MSEIHHAMPSFGAVIVGGGSGNRFGGDKLAVPVAGKPLVAWTLLAFEQTPSISSIVLVVPGGREGEFRAIAEGEGISKLTAVLSGGAHRHESVARGLRMLPEGTDFAVIHDAARPLITPPLISRCLEVAAREGAAALSAPVSDTLQQADPEGWAARTVDRSAFRAMQTPQVFRVDEIRDLLSASPGNPTDEVSVALAAGRRIPLVENLEPNIKVTWPQDVIMAEALLLKRAKTGGDFYQEIRKSGMK